MENLEIIESMRRDFVDEYSEYLQVIEESFLSYERSTLEFDNFEDLIRSCHSLKGAGKAVGYHTLVDFCHDLESLVIKINKREILYSEQLIVILTRSAKILDEFGRKVKVVLDSDISSEDLSFLREGIDNLSKLNQGLSKVDAGALTEGTSEGGSAYINVIVIDDNEAILAFMKALHNSVKFLDKSLKVEYFDDPIKGVECIESKSFDLIVTDFQMQPLNGSQVVEIVRNSAKNQSCPIIFMSGYMIDVDACANPKIYEDVHFVEKPIDLQCYINLFKRCVFKI